MNNSQLDQFRELHPVFVQALAGHINASSVLGRAKYQLDLVRMDWGFEFSDDQSVWRAGRDRLSELKAAQANFDPDAAMWNRHAPKQYQITVPK